MLFPRVLFCLLASALFAVAIAAPAGIVIVPDVADAAPAASYRVGARLRAKQNCTVRGYAIKKGVVLTVVAVNQNDEGKVGSLDLSFSGMTISGVEVETVQKYFRRA
jgi:hypothetical protein